MAKAQPHAGRSLGRSGNCNTLKGSARTEIPSWAPCICHRYLKCLCWVPPVREDIWSLESCCVMKKTCYSEESDLNPLVLIKVTAGVCFSKTLVLGRSSRSLELLQRTGWSWGAIDIPRQCEELVLGPKDRGKGMRASPHSQFHGCADGQAAAVRAGVRVRRRPC